MRPMHHTLQLTSPVIAFTALAAFPGGTNEGQGPIDIVHPTASVEDQGEDCQVSGLPASAELQNQLTLPDPFLGLNGQRLTSKSQWRCRREEIRKLGEAFIYGSKPSK